MTTNFSFVIGHLIGDYLLQTKEMALNKTNRGFVGAWYCMVHCIIYGLCIAASMFYTTQGWQELLIKDQVVLFAKLFLIGFITHFPIDRYSLGSKWMKMIKQSQLVELFPPKGPMTDLEYARRFFIAPVYIFVDMAMHLTLLWILL